MAELECLQETRLWLTGVLRESQHCKQRHEKPEKKKMIIVSQSKQVLNENQKYSGILSVLVFFSPHNVIGPEYSCHPLNQSDEQLKPTASQSLVFNHSTPRSD